MKKYLFPIYVLLVVVVSGLVTLPAASFKMFISMWIAEVVLLVSIYFIIKDFTIASKLKKVVKIVSVIIIAVLLYLTFAVVGLSRINSAYGGYKGEAYNRLSGEVEFYAEDGNLPWYKTYVCADSAASLPVFVKDCITLK